MKLINILTSIAAAALLLVGCQSEIKPSYDEIKVSQSYVGLPAEGGEQTITITASDDWTINVPSALAGWLTVEPLSGTAGQDITITFSSEAAAATRDGSLSIICAGKQQYINVVQYCEKVDLPISTWAEICAGQKGTPFRTRGMVTSITNTTYGNMYLDDFNGGSVYVYGTLDAKGAEKNFLSLGISVGDIVTVEGPLDIYGGTTYELVNVTVIKIEKSLIKVNSDPVTVAKEGESFDIELEVKGEGVSVEVPEAAKSWLSVSGINISGTTAIVSFTAAANEGGDRSTDITFVTTVTDKKETKSYSAVTTVSQLGAIVETNTKEVNEGNDGTQYRVTALIASVENSQYGNLTLRDFSGDLTVYGTLDAAGASGKFSTLGIKKHDIVKVVGPKTTYSGKAQLKNVTVEESWSVTPVTVEEFLAKSVASDVYYELTGTVSNIADATKGNFDLTDDSGKTVYVYRLTTGFGGPKDKFADTGIDNGDKITIIGVRAEYSGSAQVGSGFFVEKVVAPEVEPTVYAISLDASKLPTAYPATATDVVYGDLTLTVTNVANFGSGIQFKKETGVMVNKTEFTNIKAIKFTFPAGKFYPTNLTLTAGTDVITPTTDATALTATYDLSAKTYTGFKIENKSGYAANLEKIEIAVE